MSSLTVDDNGVEIKGPNATLSLRPAPQSAVRIFSSTGQILIHANNLDTEALHDQTMYVAHDFSETVDHDATIHFRHDRTETVDNDQTLTIHGDRTETVDGDRESRSTAAALRRSMQTRAS